MCASNCKGSIQHPIIEKEKDSFDYLQNEWHENPLNDNWTAGQLFTLMMRAQVHSDEDFNGDISDSLNNYKYQTIDKIFTDDIGDISLLNDNDVRINTKVNDIDMDNLSRSKNGNVSVLQNKQLANNKGDNGDDLVTWNSAAVQEDWWSVCQLPVFVVLFAVIGVLAITFVVLLWLKSQMIQSEKEKKLSGLDSNQIQLTSSSCPCPSPGIVPDEQWICHTVINLKSSNGENDPAAVQVQPQESCNLPQVLASKVEDVEKRPEAIRIKAKGLLERRGSSASLTIDLPQTLYDNNTHVVTPTRECTSEEFLLSAGNVLSRSQLKKCLKNVQSLHHEFWEIPLNHQEKSVVTGCGTKNRYRSILPNERTRVKLSSNDDNPLDSYINANYMRGYDGEEKAYIATQGPLPNTIQDFYRMVWNDRSPIIVMITKLYEKAKAKCELYFPMEVDEVAKYGDFQVTVVSVQPKQGYVVRELLLEHNGETRRLLHYWYDTWPDHKTPQNAHSIVAMATEIEKCRTSFKNLKSPNNNEGQNVSDGPVIVHCSAGIGRTGCFIAISLAICQLLEEDKVDILGIVCQMRYDRGGMVQTAEQYEFVHRAIALFEHSLPDATND